MSRSLESCIETDQQKFSVGDQLLNRPDRLLHPGIRFRLIADVCFIRSRIIPMLDDRNSWLSLQICTHGFSFRIHQEFAAPGFAQPDID